MVPGRTMDLCLSSGEIVMLAICEECSKKYNIDEAKMKSARARFSCRECGHIIVVVKNTPERPPETGHKPSMDLSNDGS
jgi:DNA-directed RNA polymerase subunit RPC12/RpoP